MFTPVSIRNLIDGGRQTILSIVGISFAIILIFMQLGFLGSVLDTAVLFYNNLNFDLVVRSPDYYHFGDAKDLPREYLHRIENVAGVKSCCPFHVSLGRWSYAEQSVERGMLIMGIDPTVQTFSPSRSRIVLPDVAALTSDRYILVDEKSSSEYLGFDRTTRFSPKSVGLRIELNQFECEIVGLFRMGTGLAANGACVISEQSFERINPGYGPNRVALGLIQLDQSSSHDPAAVLKLIHRSLNLDPLTAPPVVEVLTRDEVIERERYHWLANTPVGFIFLTGAVMSFFVGAIIVYIVLSADINRQLGEYATLKAMGYETGFLNRVVLEQALVLGIVSYGFSFALSLFLFKVVGEAANLPITMTVSKQLVVFVSSILMCCISAVIAMRKLRKADPADLF